MKKFLFYIPGFGCGGAERVATVLLNYWAVNSSYEITVANTLPKETDFFGIDKSIPREFLDFDYESRGIPALLERVRRVFLLRKFLKKRDEEIVVSFLTTPSMLLLISSIGLRKKIICCEHTNYYAYGNKVARLFRSLLYYLFAEKVTLLTKRDIQNYPAILREKLEVLPNPLGVDGFSFPREATHGQNNHSITKLLFVGRLTKPKGIERLCEVLEGIKQEAWELRICGDGPLRGQLEQFIKSKGLSDKMFLEGAVNNIQDYYLNADLLIMTSLWEGLPMVIAEAMSFSVPVIAFDCPTGPREFIDNNVNGLLIQDGDIKGYIHALNELLDNKDKIINLSKNAQTSVEKYTVSNINEIWNRLLS